MAHGKLKVLHVINTLDRGGAERLLLDMVRLMHEANVDVRVYVLALRDRTLFNELLRLGIDVAHGGENDLYHVSNVGRIYTAARRHGADIVHSHLFPAMLWASLGTIALPKVHLVYTEHDTRNRRRRLCFWPMERAMYWRYSRIACISEACELALIKWLPATRVRTVVIANGVDLTRFASVPRAIEHGMPRIVSVGRLVHKKGFDVLIRALSIVPDVTLEIIGDGPLRGELEELAETLGVRQRVALLGNREDVPSLLTGATAYVQASRWEGFGLAAVEAMCTGVPTIVSDVPGLREVVGDAGLTFEPGSHVELAARLRTLLSDRALQKSLSSRARERAKEFNISRTVEEYIRLYSEVASELPGSAA